MRPEVVSVELTETELEVILEGFAQTVESGTVNPAHPIARGLARKITDAYGVFQPEFVEEARLTVADMIAKRNAARNN